MIGISYNRKVKMTEQTNTKKEQFKFVDKIEDTPTLKEAQDFVGGMVECVTWPNGDLLIVNEEGKLMGLPCLLYTSDAADE